MRGSAWIKGIGCGLILSALLALTWASARAASPTDTHAFSRLIDARGQSAAAEDILRRLGWWCEAPAEASSVPDQERSMACDEAHSSDHPGGLQGAAHAQIQALALAAYSHVLSQSEAVELVDYYGTPTGRIRVQQLDPLLIRGVLRAARLITQCTQSILEKYLRSNARSKSLMGCPRLDTVPLAPSRERALALTLIAADDGLGISPERLIQMRLRAASFVRALVGQAKGTEPRDNGDTAGQRADMAVAILESRLSTDYLTDFAIRPIVDTFDEPTLSTLVADAHSPRRRHLYQALQRGDVEFVRSLIERFAPRLRSKVLNPDGTQREILE